MKQLISFLSITLFLSCGFGASNNLTQPTDSSAAHTTVARTGGAGFYYLEITPTVPAIPFYFSQVVFITYKDINDLNAQLDASFEKLRIEAKKDGYDPKNYNQVSSKEAANNSDCQQDKDSNIKALKAAGNIVKEVKV